MPEQTADPPYAIRRRHDGRSRLIELRGEIDVLAAPPGSDFLDDTYGGPGAETDVIVDLRPVTFIDGSGLNALLRTAGRLSASRHSLAVVATDPFHRRLLRLVGLGPNTTLHRTISDASRPVPSRTEPGVEAKPTPLVMT